MRSKKAETILEFGQDGDTSPDTYRRLSAKADRDYQKHVAEVRKGASSK